MEVQKMRERLKRAVKSANGKGPHPESRTTSEVTAPPPVITKDADRNAKEAEEAKDENAFCVPWYLP